MSDAKRNEIQAVLQASIDCPGLQPYYHADLPERRPLRIVKHDLAPPDMKLVKFGQPVRFIDPPAESDESAYLAIRSLSVENGAAVVELAYPIEGVVATIRLRDDGGWKIQEASVVEQE